MKKSIYKLIDLLKDLEINNTIINIKAYFVELLSKYIKINDIIFYKFNYKTNKFISSDENNIDIDDLLSKANEKKQIIFDGNKCIIPLIYRDKSIAFLYIISKNNINKSVFKKEEIKFSISICSLIYYNVNIYNLAIKDPLTKIYNLRYFNYKLQEYYHNFRENKKNIAVIMLDIDHFKHYNDKYGHKVGDVILQTLTKEIKSALSDNVIFSRYGGEEFLVLLSDHNIKKTIKVAENIRKKVEKIKITNNDYFWKLTISAGISNFPDDTDNINDLLLYADMALYYSKRNGRNRVSTYEYDVKK